MAKYKVNDRVVLKRRILSYLNTPADPQPGTAGTVVWADSDGGLDVKFDGYSVYSVREYMLRRDHNTAAIDTDG
jgi:hypothetical protein